MVGYAAAAAGYAVDAPHLYTTINYWKLYCEQGMMTIIVPILPGKSEAWRRLLQELGGSRREQLRAWCAHWGIGDLTISLSETAERPLAVISFRDLGLNQAPVGEETPFMRWLSKQLLAVHGIDLPVLLAGHSRSLLFELQSAQ